jgi:hypothetical protein
VEFGILLFPENQPTNVVMVLDPLADISRYLIMFYKSLPL